MTGAVAGAVTGAVGSAVTGAVGSAVTGAVGVGFSAVFGAAAAWVASGAVWLLGEVGHALSATTTVDVGSGWFSAQETVMASLAAAVAVPMVCCAALQAVYRQSSAMLVRAFLVHLPLALLLTGVAVTLVQMALGITDALSARVLAGSATDTTNVFATVTDVLAQTGVAAPAAPPFVVFLGGLLVAAGALGLWLELAVRAAAVSAATLFLPLVMAALVWPAVSHWCRRLADTLAALVLSKLVIAAVLSLAAAAVAGGLGAGSTGGHGGGFAAVVTGVALLLVATVSPFSLLRLVPAVEAGAVSHLESARHRLAGTARTPTRVGNLALDVAREAGTPAGTSTATASEVGAASTSLPLVAGTALSPAVHAVFDGAGRGGGAAEPAPREPGAGPGAAAGVGRRATGHEAGTASTPARGAVPGDAQAPGTMPAGGTATVAPRGADHRTGQAAPDQPDGVTP